MQIIRITIVSVLSTSLIFAFMICLNGTGLNEAAQCIAFIIYTFIILAFGRNIIRLSGTSNSKELKPDAISRIKKYYQLLLSPIK